MKDQGSTRIIKRYSNRKLYDTESSRYVTLNDISGLVKNGVEVGIIDNSSHEDITSVVLAQIILEAEKNRGETSINVLRRIIQSGGETISDLIARKAGQKKGERRPRDGKQILKGLSESAQRSIDELQARVDEFVSAAVTASPVAKSVHTELISLQDRIKQLEDRLRKLRKGLGDGF
ncbi:MAG: polyhydroxyalkanoate synthesis regulator DNA-binding domain-containing protein [Myxococcota bacterium]|jgi:polyhydroxyalkanoate synthesis repressor PhaR